MNKQKYTKRKRGNAFKKREQMHTNTKRKIIIGVSLIAVVISAITISAIAISAIVRQDKSGDDVLVLNTHDDSDRQSIVIHSSGM